MSVSIVTLISNFRKKYVSRPTLEISIIPNKDKCYLKKKWASTKSSVDDLLYIYERCWGYDLIIKNTSKHDAYYPKLNFDRVLPHYSKLSVLNHYVPIPAKDKVVLVGEYVILEERHETKQPPNIDMPKEFHRVKLLLEYQNAEKTKFYTVFEFRNATSHLERFKPSEFAI